MFLRLAPRLPAVVCQHRLPLGARQPEALGLTAEPAGGPLLMTQGSPALSGPLEGDGSDGEKASGHAGCRCPWTAVRPGGGRAHGQGVFLGVFCSRVLGGCRAGLSTRPEQCCPEA